MASRSTQAKLLIPARTPEWVLNGGNIMLGGMTEEFFQAKDVSLFARTLFRGDRRVFGIRQADRLAHMHVLGKTGSGKSTLLKNLMVSDIVAGKGFALIDPHGDLVEDVLDLIPPERVDDVIYFNPADHAYPVGFNPLDSGANPQLVVSGILEVFKKAWPDFWGPRTEYVLRNCLLTLVGIPGTTILDVRRLLVDLKALARAQAKIKDPALQSFWNDEFRRWEARFRNEVISPILNKLGQLVMTPMIRNIIGQPRNAFRLREVMDRGKILLVNLAKGKIGEDTATLFGSMFRTLIQVAALSRADVDEEERRPFFLYIDEFGSVATPAFVNLLPELRKFHAGVVVAHQYLGQLDEELQSSVLGTVGTLVCFRVGAEDAKLLAQEFYPVFNEEDLVSLPAFHFYVRLMIDGSASKPFSAVSLPPPTQRCGMREEIIQKSRTRYARPVADVEWELIRRFGASGNGVRQGRLLGG